MRISRLLLLPLPLLVLACGGSDAGNVFDKTDQDSGQSSTVDSATTAEDTSKPGDNEAEPPPPLDSGTVGDDAEPPPPVDTGIALDTAVPPVDTGTGCTDPGGKTFGGHCYFPTPEARYWTTSRDYCTSKGAHLVTITSAEEQVFVATVGTGERWIGLYRPEGSPYMASSFRWVTTETGTYRNWASGEPNFSGSCARMRTDGWADQSCATNYIAVCERE